jgi:hypothetical protein
MKSASSRISSFVSVVVVNVGLPSELSIPNFFTKESTTQIRDADEACRSSEISVNLIIIIVFL